MVQLFLFYWGNQLVENPYWRPKGSIPGMGDSSPIPYDGEGRYEHFRNLAQMIFPKVFEWNEWSEKIARALCGQKHVAICGCAGSSKSTTTGLYAFFWYIAAPNQSAVLIASTTIEAARKRIWKEVRKFYVEFVRQARRLGDLVILNSPRPCIQASRTDKAHGLYVVAVTKGEAQKGVDTLKGFHPERILMIGDETDSIGDAVVEVGANQEVGTLEYQTIWLGNDPSLFNPLGKMMQPEPGKPVTLAHTEWTSATGVYCLRLDAYDSPNLRDGDKWKGIIRKKDIDAIVSRYGANSPQVWIMLRGLHPPEGADDTVLSEALFVRNNCSAKVVWKRSFTTLGLLDPAFGGDRCVFRTLDYGHDTEGHMRVLLGDPVEIQIDASDKQNPPEYQIARKVKALCEARGIKPQDFILDSTGTGRGVRSVLMVEWSPNINFCEFGGKPSEMPVSDENPRPASEEYDRKVTELWYSFRVFVEAGMIRGLDAATALEFCSRKFEIRAKKTRVEEKGEMKERGAPSPDLADCVVVGIHLLRERGINATVTSDVKKEYTQDYARKLKEHDIDGWKENYSAGLDDVAAFEHMY